MKKNFYSLLILLLIVSNSIFAQKKEIIFVSAPVNKSGVNYYLDSAIIDAINAYGGGTVYNVTAEYTSTNNGLITSAMKAQLSAADVVIMGRGIGSNQLTPAKTVWDSITKPVLAFQHFAFRKDRLDWYNSTTGSNNFTSNPDTVLKAVVLQKTDPVFAGITLLGDSAFDWWTSHFSYMQNNVLGDCNCTIMSRTIDNKPLFVRWPANTPYYTTATHQPLAERVYITNGQDNTVPYSYWNFTGDAQTVFFRELGRLAGLSTNVTDAQSKVSKVSIYAIEGAITVSSTEDLYRVDIYSVTGKLLVSASANGNRVVLKNTLKKGVYIAKAINKEGIAIAKKFLVQ